MAHTQTAPSQMPEKGRFIQRLFSDSSLMDVLMFYSENVLALEVLLGAGCANRLRELTGVAS